MCVCVNHHETFDISKYTHSGIVNAYVFVYVHVFVSMWWRWSVFLCGCYHFFNDGVKHIKLMRSMVFCFFSLICLQRLLYNSFCESHRHHHLIYSSVFTSVQTHRQCSKYVFIFHLCYVCLAPKHETPICRISRKKWRIIKI